MTRRKKMRFDRDLCPRCQRWYPSDPVQLVVQAYIDGRYVLICPLCYAQDVLRVHGVAWVPSSDTQAGMMYSLALEHVKKTGQ